MPLNCGIVGLPNVGKIHHLQRPHLGQGAGRQLSLLHHRPQHRRRHRARRAARPKSPTLIKPKSLVPTTMEFIDIAGLVEGASKGEGLGNQFLGHIRATDAIVPRRPLLRRPRGRPRRRRRQSAPRHRHHQHRAAARRPRHRREAPRQSREAATSPPTPTTRSRAEFAALAKLKASPRSRQARPHRRPHRRREALHPRPLPHHRQAAALRRQRRRVRPHQRQRLHRRRRTARRRRRLSQVVRICGAMEAEIAQLEPAERTEFLESTWASPSPASTASSTPPTALLDLITYFTAGVQEVRAWTIRRGTKAPGAAGVIHSDFEKGFIKADCYASDDLFTLRQRAGRQRKRPPPLRRQRVRRQRRRHPLLQVQRLAIIPAELDHPDLINREGNCLRSGSRNSRCRRRRCN